LDSLQEHIYSLNPPKVHVLQGEWGKSREIVKTQSGIRYNESPFYCSNVKASSSCSSYLFKRANVKSHKTFMGY